MELRWDRVEGQRARTIEHVLPQNLDAKDRYWHERFTASERGELMHDLGNLCLTDDNSALGNHPFPEKKGFVGKTNASGKLAACYANSNVFQEKELAGLTDWTPSTVAARRLRLLAWARERWAVAPAPVAGDVVDEPEDDLTAG